MKKIHSRTSILLIYEINVGPADRYLGYTIRPVTPKAN